MIPAAAALRLSGEEYVALRLIGAGASGNVWAAQRLSDGRHVAVKVVPIDGTHRSKGEANQEAELLASCHSPFIVNLVDRDADGARMVTVMELVDGVDLSAHLLAIKHQRATRAADQPVFTVPEVCMWAAQLLLAVHHIHSRGIVHRDLKPANIFCCSTGLLKVGDFGLSCAAADLLTGTKPVGGPAFLGSHAVGTPGYMAPELWSTELPPYSTASDMWAVGVILYELLTGRLPFYGATNEELGTAVLEAQMKPICVKIPHGLRSLILQLLSTDSKERPTALDALRTSPMRRALDTLAAVLPIDPNVGRETAGFALDAIADVTSKLGPVDLPTYSGTVEKWGSCSDGSGGRWKRRTLQLTHEDLQLRLLDGALPAPGSRTALSMPIAYIRGVRIPSDADLEKQALHDPGFSVRSEGGAEEALSRSSALHRCFFEVTFEKRRRSTGGAHRIRRHLFAVEDSKEQAEWIRVLSAARMND